MSQSRSVNAPMVGKPVVGLAETAFETYRLALYQLLARRLPRPEDIEDVIQEAFLRLLRVPEDTFLRNPQAYLYGIACKVAHDFRRKAQDGRVTFDSDVAAERAENPPHVDADELGNWIGAQRQVERAMSELTPTQLKILIGECRDGLTHREIAQQMGLSVHTVKKYSVQALARVRSGWDSYKPESEPEGPDHAA